MWGNSLLAQKKDPLLPRTSNITIALWTSMCSAPVRLFRRRNIVLEDPSGNKGGNLSQPERVRTKVGLGTCNDTTPFITGHFSIADDMMANQIAAMNCLVPF